MKFEELMKKKVLLVVVNKTVVDNSTPEQKEQATLQYWKLNVKRALEIEYVIGIKNGVAVSCYKVGEIGISKINDGRVFFNSCEDLTDIVEGKDLKALGIRKGYKEVQYINC